MTRRTNLICAICALLAVCLPTMAANVTWKSTAPNPGNASDPNNWIGSQVPENDDKAILPNYGGFYTVLVDVPWHIDDLEIGRFATGYLDCNNLKVDKSSEIWGTLKVRAATYDGTVSLENGTGYGGNLVLDNGTMVNSVRTDSNTSITGWGYINNLPSNDGEIRAQGGILSVDFGADNHDDGIISADTGATLKIRDNHDFRNKAAINLNGGTLQGYSNAFQLRNYGTSSQHAVISGYGVIDDYVISTHEGYSEINVNGGSGKTLKLNEGFYNRTCYDTLRISNGTTFEVYQHDVAYWNNDATTTMTGGSITGEQMRQRGALSVASGVNTVQDAIFYGHVGTNTVSGGATLRITGSVAFDTNTLIAESGAGGYFKVDGGSAVVAGYGTINPDTTVTNGGILAGNSSGNTLAVNGAIDVHPGSSAYATGGGTLDLNGAVSNSGNLYANNGAVTIDAAVTNSGNLYAGNSGQVALNGDVNNRGSVYTDSSGTVNIAGTIKADAANDGDFTANSGQININGAIESGVRNIFVANAGGTINFANDLSTATFNETDALRPRGGTITLATGKTLTNVSGNEISGYGTLLDNNRYLVNSGTIEACGGTLNVHGDITNNGIMRANGEDDILSINSTLAVGDTGSIYTVNGGTVNLGSSLTNDGEIYAGDDGEVHISDTTPTGKGTFTANDDGAIYFADGFTNAGLTTANALRLGWGRISVAAGAMTNAAGKQITGSGYLLGGGGTGTLTNYGEVIAGAGGIQFDGAVDNFGKIYADEAGGVTFDYTLDNKSGGLVQATGGATVTCGSAGGAGVFSLADSQMLCRGSLTMEENGYLLDNDSTSTVDVWGSLAKKKGALEKFDANQIALSIYQPLGLIGAPDKHKVEWLAEDYGRDTKGLINNLALGKLIFGDGIGLEDSDAFELFGETNIYVFGLEILGDAYVNLGGRTIYYLKEGYEVNGIVGTGFLENGNWDNGYIVEIPEPASAVLLLSGGVLILLRRRRK